MGPFCNGQSTRNARKSYSGLSEAPQIFHYSWTAAPPSAVRGGSPMEDLGPAHTVLFLATEFSRLYWQQHDRALVVKCLPALFVRPAYDNYCVIVQRSLMMAKTDASSNSLAGHHLKPCFQDVGFFDRIQKHQ